MLAFQINIIGLPQLQNSLGDFANRVRDLSPAFESIHQDFLRIEEEQFAGKGVGPSGPWPALSKEYAAWKVAHGFGTDILVLTGALKRSLTEDGGDHIKEIRPQEAKFGTRNLFPSGWSSGAVHQVARGKGRPARPSIDISERNAEDWKRMIEDYIYGGK